MQDPRYRKATDQHGAMTGEINCVLNPPGVTLVVMRDDLPAMPPCGWQNEWLKIEVTPNAAILSVSPEYAWDGPPERGITIPSAYHDAGYQFSSDIEKAWLWTEHEVLEWFNAVFEAGMVADDANVIFRDICCELVERFGQTYHDIKTQGLWPVLTDVLVQRLDETAGVHGDREGA